MSQRLRCVLGAFTCAIVATLAMGPGATAAASPAGALEAAFHGYFSGGNGAAYATWVRAGDGYSHAANRALDLDAGAVRIPPVSDSEQCASNLFGIWVFLVHTDKAEVADTTFTMALGPADGPLTPLNSQASAIKPLVDPQGVFAGEPVWWRSIGVPVYGNLEPGEYRLASSSNIFGDSEVSVTVNDC